MSELNLIQGDANHNLRGIKIAGQTFHPTYDHILEWIDLDLRLGSFMTSISICIYFANGSHEPFGDVLSRDRFIVDKPWNAMAMNRVRHSMQPYLLTEGEYYAIVVRATIPLFEPDVLWRYKTAPSSYPAGHRIWSNDSGSNWTHEWDEDFIFGEFGTPPSPAPPPEPPIFKNMPLDIEQILIADGFKIIYTTNVPCHCYMRWTLKPPIKHIEPVFLRGFPIWSDLRQCFVAYHDNEQEEAGDTLTHTFIKTGWPVCETRYFFFWSKCATLNVVSTSPIFTKHRAEEYVPPVEHMDELVSIEPQLRHLAVANVWTAIDLTHEIHPNATGVIFCVINTDVGAGRQFGIRAKGSAHTWVALQKKHTHTWGLCPVSSDRKIEYFTSFAGVHDLWILGYTGPNVHFLEPPVDITPPGTSTWTLKDLAAIAPNAKAVILDLGNSANLTSGWGARCFGSADNRVRGCGHSFPVIKCDTTQKVELYLWPNPAAVTRAYLIGYITDNVTMEVNAPDLQAGPNNAWIPYNVAVSYPTPKFAFLEWASPATWVDFGAQKRYSLRGVVYDGDNHNWAIVHCNHGSDIEVWHEFAVDGQFLQGVSH